MTRFFSVPSDPGCGRGRGRGQVERERMDVCLLLQLLFKLHRPCDFKMKSNSECSRGSEPTPSAGLRERPSSSSQLLGVHSCSSPIACGCIPPALACESLCSTPSLPPLFLDRISLVLAYLELGKYSRLALTHRNLFVSAPQVLGLKV